MSCENMLRPFGNVINFLLGQNNYEKFAMAWFHFKMRTNFTNENVKYLENVIHEGDWCLDIGANRGEITYYMSLLAGDKGKIISFEPVTKARFLLNDTVKKFKLSNVLICPRALSNEKGELKMLIPKVNGVSVFALAHLVSNNQDAHESGYYETVQVTTIDIIIGKLSPKNISFIKCDVEGHELEVFQGGETTLNKYKPVVLAEIWEHKQQIENGKITSDLIKFFEAHGYIGKIVHDKAVRDLDAAYIKENKIQDFFFFPPSSA